MSLPIDIEADKAELPEIVTQNPIFLSAKRREELKIDREYPTVAILAENHNIDMNEFEFYKLQKIFAIADLTHMGYIGHKQFKDLMIMLGIEPTDVSPAACMRPAAHRCRSWRAGHTTHSTARAHFRLPCEKPRARALSALCNLLSLPGGLLLCAPLPLA